MNSVFLLYNLVNHLYFLIKLIFIKIYKYNCIVKYVSK